MIGVAGCVWGDYHQYVERWYGSLVRAGTDQIVLVTDKPRPDIPCEQILSPSYGKYREAAWWTAGVDRLTTEYAATLGVDDELLPDCWDGISGDVWLLGMQVPGRHAVTPPYDTAHDYLMHRAAIACHASPFRKSWFQGYPDVAYSDWKIYLDMARRGAVFVNPKKIGVVHHEHPGSLSTVYYRDHHRHYTEALA